MIKEKEFVTLGKCIDFLRSIGINVKNTILEDKTFLPGLKIENGSILLDLEKLVYPGDILHEAAHIAVVPSIERKGLQGDDLGNRENREAEEMMALAWSYAACVHLQIEPEFVFHDGGYKGGSFLAQNFKGKKYIAVPMLEWTGMAAGDKYANEINVQPYPYMLKWLRD